MVARLLVVVVFFYLGGSGLGMDTDTTYYSLS
jgi:hypothetical protein